MWWFSRGTQTPKKLPWDFGWRRSIVVYNQMFLEWLMFHRHFLSPYNFPKNRNCFFLGGTTQNNCSACFFAGNGWILCCLPFSCSIFWVHFCMDFWSEALGRRALTLVGAYETAAWHDENWVSKWETDEFDVFYSFNKFSVTYAWYCIQFPCSCLAPFLLQYLLLRIHSLKRLVQPLSFTRLVGKVTKFSVGLVKAITKMQRSHVWAFWACGSWCSGGLVV